MTWTEGEHSLSDPNSPVRNLLDLLSYIPYPFSPCWLRQAAGERSKTVILVKNLPAGTSPAELEELFGKHGDLGRVLLPEGGITAIVEFLEPSEAKQAFTSLAYSKVGTLPGEWDPGELGSCRRALSEREWHRECGKGVIPEPLMFQPVPFIFREVPGTAEQGSACRGCWRRGL